jgi:endonuclease-3
MAAGTKTVPRKDWKRPSARRVASIRERLRGLYGVPVIAPHGDPLGELILTVLSQSTNDRNRDVAFLRLRKRFASWEEVRAAPVDEVEEAIRPGGISKVNSQRIHDILEAIGDPLDLEWMRDAPLEQSQQYLCALPGVGRKTAACVLCSRLGCPIFRSIRTYHESLRASVCCGRGRRLRNCMTR